MMDAGYKILVMNSHGPKVVAVLPLSRVVGRELSQTLREDYLRLAESAPVSVELDLRAVEFIDGSFCTRLLELRKSLQQRSASLQLRVSSNLQEVMKVTRLDRILDVVDDSGCQGSERAEQVAAEL